MLDQAASLREIARGRNPMAYGAGSRSSCQVIAVTSGKGGVGKTNVVVNLAIALQKAGRRVAILDADFGLANVDVFFGLTPTYHLGHVLAGQLPMDSIIQEGPQGVHIIPASSGIQELADLDEYKRRRILIELAQVLDAYDFVLIDTAAGISSNVLSLLAASGRVVVVSVPEPTAILDAYALIKVLRRQNQAKEVLLLINLVRDRKEAEQVFGQLARVVKQFLGQNVSLLGFVLKDDRVSQAVRHQIPLIVSHPGIRVSRCFTEIAEVLVSGPPRPGLEISDKPLSR